MFAFIRREHLRHPEHIAAVIRRRCIEVFGGEVIAFDLKAGGLRKLPLPKVGAFQRILKDVRAYYALGVETRRAGFDRVLDRFARARLVTALGESEVSKLEERIRGLMEIIQ